MRRLAAFGLSALVATSHADIDRHDRADGKTRNGLREGVWQFWRELDGFDKRGRPLEEPVARGTYLHGRKHGRWTHWYWTNQKRAEIECRNNKPHGHYRTWTDEGRRHIEGQYVDGRMHGIWREYGAPGPATLGEYRNGKRIRGYPIDLCEADSCSEGDSGLLLCMSAGDEGEQH
jgi:hypothetical protein